MIAANSIRSSPSRRASAAAKPETTPKQMTGVAARTETVAVERCRVDSSSGKIGGRLVIAVRRLKPSAITPTTSSVCSSRACAVAGRQLLNLGHENLTVPDRDTIRRRAGHIAANQLPACACAYRIATAVPKDAAYDTCGVSPPCW